MVLMLACKLSLPISCPCIHHQSPSHFPCQRRQAEGLSAWSTYYLCCHATHRDTHTEEKEVIRGWSRVFIDGEKMSTTTERSIRRMVKSLDPQCMNTAKNPFYTQVKYCVIHSNCYIQQQICSRERKMTQSWTPSTGQHWLSCEVLSLATWWIYVHYSNALELRFAPSATADKIPGALAAKCQIMFTNFTLVLLGTVCARTFSLNTAAFIGTKLHGKEQKCRSEKNKKQNN